MHQFIKFHYGPQWSLHIPGNSRSSKLATISPSEIRTCLSQLPFLSTTTSLSIRSCDSLCTSEQVQVSEDLRNRLIENMITCCNSTFIHQYLPFHHHHQYNNNNDNFNSNNSRNSFFRNNNKHLTATLDLNTNNTTTTWAYCFLFAREKLVAQCHNQQYQQDDLPDEFIYFLKLLVSHYLQEKHESGNV
jgi:hypothetical protein